MTEQRRVISVVFCLPNSIGYADGKWDIGHRRGTSALFDALTYLSSRGPHTILGWTGEIKSTAGAEGLQLSRDDRRKFERELASSSNGKVSPVWLWDDVDDQKDIATFKSQRRWRQFADPNDSLQ